ncbi:helix-turn-helix domain-containing protein [Clostridium sporogenes]
MENLQSFLIKKRKELKLSLRNAAKLIGISHSYLSTLEKGIDPRNNAPVKPTPETLHLISEAYNTSYEHLMKVSGYLDNEIEASSNLFSKHKKAEKIAEHFIEGLLKENIDPNSITEEEIDKMIKTYKLYNK